MTNSIATLLKALLRDTKGVALAEFAIVCPVVVMLGLAAAEIGRAVQHHHAIEKAARDAGRYLARVQADCQIANPLLRIAADDVTAAKNLAITGYVSGVTPILSYWNDPNTITVSVDCFDNSAGTFRGLTAIPLVTVSIIARYEDIGFLAGLGILPMDMVAEHSEMNLGE